MDLESEVELRCYLAQLLERLEQAGPLQLHRVRVQEHRGQVAPPGRELDGPPPEQPAQLGLAADALGDAQELERVLGQLRVAPAAEGLVRRHRAAREQHDRLEHHRDLALAKQVAQLAGALGEAVRQLAAGQHGRGGLGVVVAARLVDVRAAHAELEVREVHDVALDERRVLDLRPVDEAPVAAAEVAQPQVLAAPVDLRVELRDRVGRQHQLEPLPAADPERQHVDRHALQPAAFRDGLQVPAARRFLAAHAAGPFMR